MTGRSRFRSDLASLLIRESLMRCIRSDGPRELPQQIGEMAFCDTASGGGDGKEQGDAYGLAIARRGPTGKSIVVIARQWTAPFDPFETTREICAILHSRGLRTVTGDRYSPGWVAGAFKMNGIEYVVSERNKSQIYMDMAALVNSEGVEIPDDPILIHQLLHLQRRTGSGGRDNIDHPKHGRDDLANSVSGAATLALHATGPVSLDSLMVSGSICPKNSGLAEEHRVNCVLFGGGYQPSDPICRKACVPWQTVKPQYDAYRRQGGEQPLRLFVRERFTNRIMQANDWFYLRQDTEAMLGL